MFLPNSEPGIVRGMNLIHKVYCHCFLPNLWKIYERMKVTDVLPAVKQL